MARRQRTDYLVSAVILGHFVLISAQVGAGPSGSVLEELAFRGFSEIQRMLTGARDTVAQTWSRYVALRDVRAENEALAERVQDLQVLLQEQRALAQQARGLQQLLGLRETLEVRTVGARIIAISATPYVRTITIDRGAEDGVYAEAAVVAPQGVVGRVIGTPAPRAARVQLLIDRLAAAGARVERTRATGIVSGGGDGLRMEYVANHMDVRVGDRIVTSGADGIYPPGFVIGSVGTVEPGPELDLSIRLFPAVEFSRLEDVLVVLRGEPQAPLSVATE